MKFTYSFALAAALVGVVGCSAKTETETKEAVEQIKEAGEAAGDAVKAAGEEAAADTKAAVEEGAADLKDAADATVDAAKDAAASAADAAGDAADEAADAVEDAARHAKAAADSAVRGADCPQSAAWRSIDASQSAHASSATPTNRCVARRRFFHQCADLPELRRPRALAPLEERRLDRRDARRPTIRSAAARCRDRSAQRVPTASAATKT